jgi:hypothetical protein
MDSAVRRDRQLLRSATWQFWTGRIRLEHLIWAATINIAGLYVFGMIPFASVGKSFTITTSGAGGWCICGWSSPSSSSPPASAPIC